MNLRASILTWGPLAKVPGRNTRTVKRLFSQQVPSRSEHYSIVQDVSFLQPPFAQVYASSTDSSMDASMASMDKPFDAAQPPIEPIWNMLSMVNDKPWKLRIVIPEYSCQTVTEMQTGEPNHRVSITLQKGLRESDHGPAVQQPKLGLLDRVREWMGAGKVGSNDNEVTCREWYHSPSFTIFSDWTAREDGRLVLPLLQRNSSVSAGHDRTKLRQMESELKDDLPFESAEALIYLYSFARNLSITSLETHVADKWRQTFDVMPEHPHVYLSAMKILQDTSSIEDPLVARLIHQLAYSLLWKGDLANHTAGDLSTAERYLSRTMALSTGVLRGYAPHLTFLAHRLAESMDNIVLRVAAQQSSRTCDFVSADPRVIYEGLESTDDANASAKS